MKKLKAREQHKCSYCSKPAEWNKKDKYACVNHKIMLKDIVQITVSSGQRPAKNPGRSPV